MGIFESLSDKAIEKLTKKETIRLTFEQIADIVKDEFIKGSDDEFLKKVAKTAKGGGLFVNKKLESETGRYELHVGGIQNGLIFGRRKTVWVWDKEANKFYQLDKDRKWKKFYKSVLGEINMEKINRNR